MRGISTMLAAGTARRALSVLVLSATTVAVGSTGYALWSVTGSGPTQGASISAAPVTLAAVAGTADLYPSSTGAVSFTVNNTNPYAITVTGLTFGTVTSSDPGNCPASNITVNNRTGLSIAVPANTTSGTLTAAGSVTMIGAAPDGCQGKTFTVATTVTGTQS